VPPHPVDIGEREQEVRRLDFVEQLFKYCRQYSQAGAVRNTDQTQKERCLQVLFLEIGLDSVDLLASRLV